MDHHSESANKVSSSNSLELEEPLEPGTSSKKGVIYWRQRAAGRRATSTSTSTSFGDICNVVNGNDENVDDDVDNDDYDSNSSGGTGLVNDDDSDNINPPNCRRRSSAFLFVEACHRAIALGADLVLEEGAVVDIGSDSLRVSKNRQVLTIRCAGPRGATIMGSGHSVFIVEGKHTKLVLENITVLHNSRVDIPRRCGSGGEGRGGGEVVVGGNYSKRDVGAVLYVRNRGSAVLSRCAMVSRLGFGLWAVQKASVALSGCLIRSISRSGCVLFCDAAVSVQVKNYIELYQIIIILYYFSRSQHIYLNEEYQPK